MSQEVIVKPDSRLPMRIFSGARLAERDLASIGICQYSPEIEILVKLMENGRQRGPLREDLVHLEIYNMTMAPGHIAMTALCDCICQLVQLS